MEYKTFLIALTLTILATEGCNGDQIDEKLFGFLKSAEKCLKESNPQECIKRNLNAWCEKRSEKAKIGTHVCECVDVESRLVNILF